MRLNICIFLMLSFVSEIAFSSCQEELKEGIAKFDFVTIEGTPSERLVVTLPKDVNEWPLESIEFGYTYGEHFIRTRLAYESVGDLYKSEVLFASKFKRSVRVSVNYKSPVGECGIYKQYGYKNA